MKGNRNGTRCLWVVSIFLLLLNILYFRACGTFICIFGASSAALALKISNHLVANLIIKDGRKMPDAGDDIIPVFLGAIESRKLLALITFTNY